MTMLSRLLFALLVTVAGGVGAASAQNYPDHPIRMVVPFAPGGPTDVVARLVAVKLGDKLGRTVIVDNRAGADGIVGSEFVAKAKPDGYTLLLNASAHAQNAATYSTLPYDTEKAFAPVALLVNAPFILVVNPSLPVHTTAELIAYAKSHAGKLNYASAGAGGVTHLAGEMLKRTAGIDMVHVPYKGGGPALVSLAGNETQVMIAPMLVALPMIKSGQIRALGITSLKRSPVLPDLPTVAETLPGFEALTWYAVFAPAETPAPIVDKLNKALNEIIAMPEVKERFAAIGGTPAGGTPADLGKFVHEEIIKWTKVAKAAGVKIQ